MTTEVEKLTKLIAANGITHISVFPGTNSNVTAEQVATEINKSIQSILDGKFDLVPDTVD